MATHLGERLDVAATSLYDVEKAMKTVGAIATSREPTPGACGYTRITVLATTTTARRTTS